MKKKVISLMLVVLILMTGCGENKKTDFNKIGEQLKKSDAEFSNYKEVFNDFTGGKEVSNFEQNEYYEEQKDAKIRLVKINDLYASVTLSTAQYEIEDKNQYVNTISLSFDLEENDMSIEKIEDAILEALENDFGELEFSENESDDSITKFYENEDMKDEGNGFIVRYTRSDYTKHKILDGEYLSLNFYKIETK